MAAGINDTFRQVGIAVGIAAWGALFLGRGADKVAELAAGTPAAERRPPAAADRSRLLGQPRPGAELGARGGRGKPSPTPPARVPRGDERDPPARRACSRWSASALALLLVREGEIEREEILEEGEREADGQLAFGGARRLARLPDGPPAAGRGASGLDGQGAVGHHSPMRRPGFGCAFSSCCSRCRRFRPPTRKSASVAGDAS